MKLSYTERLLLWNQHEIRKYLNKESTEHCENVQEALESGYEPLYGTLLGHLSKEQITEEQAAFVYNVLDMFDALHRFEQKTGKSIDDTSAKFRGFDGHGDLVGFTRFNVEKLRRWEWLNIKEFDAHFPIEQVYERMLEVWLRKPSPERFNLSQQEVAAILAASIHPEHRSAK